MPDGYCEVADVSSVLQDDFPGSNPSTSEVEDAITGFTQWVRAKTNSHWYDSNNQPGDLVPTSARSTTGIRLDVPSSPHRQDRQLLHDEQGIRYPVTHAGPYARIRLPHYSVQTLNALEVRDRDGDVTDWTSDPDISSGKGNDYYLHVDGGEIDTSYLYINADSIGPRTDYRDLLTLDYDYGRDAQNKEWQTVRRAVATLAAADVALDDDIQAAVPDDGQLVPVNTKSDKMINRAMKQLRPYFAPAVA